MRCHRLVYVTGEGVTGIGRVTLCGSQQVASAEDSEIRATSIAEKSGIARNRINLGGDRAREPWRFEAR